MSKVMEQWLASAPSWILEGPEWLNTLLYKLFKCFIYDDRYMMLLNGLKLTVILSLCSVIIGIETTYVVAHKRQ